jgi:hypothetical protein
MGFSSHPPQAKERIGAQIGHRLLAGRHRGATVCEAVGGRREGEAAQHDKARRIIEAPHCNAARNAGARCCCCN